MLSGRCSAVGPRATAPDSCLTQPLMHARRALLTTRSVAMKSKPKDEELLIAPLQSLHLDKAYRWCGGLQGIGRLQRMSASSIAATLNAVTGERCGASVGVEASHPKVLSLRIYSRRACLAEAFKNGNGRRFGHWSGCWKSGPSTMQRKLPRFRSVPMQPAGG